MWRKICCAIDLSPQSDTVARTAAAVARTQGAGLILLNVEKVRDESAIDPQPELTEAAHARREYALQDAKRAAADVSDGAVEATVLADHDPVGRIVDFAHAAGCDLIVVGARAPSRHSPFESFAEKLVRRAHCSVLVVRQAKPLSKEAP